MATSEKTTEAKPPSKACRERVVEARLRAGSHLFAANMVLTTTPGHGCVCESLHLHPGGVLAVWNGKRIVVAVDYAVLAEEQE